MQLIIWQKKYLYTLYLCLQVFRAEANRLNFLFWNQRGIFIDIFKNFGDKMLENYILIIQKVDIHSRMGLKGFEQVQNIEDRKPS